MRKFTEDFKRFKDGNTFEITFDSDGLIERALIFTRELDDGIDVTAYVQDDEYWVGEVAYWLYEYYYNKKDRQLWDSSKQL